MGKLIKNFWFLSLFIIIALHALFDSAESIGDNNTDMEKGVTKFTSKAMSVDEWLYSEDLFPGHVIPHNINHADAIKLFTKLVDDHDILSEAYNKYRMQHNKDIEDGIKHDARKIHFKENLHFIFQHNLQHDAGQFGFQLGVNMFADMSREEMSHFLGAKDKLPIHPENHNATSPHGPSVPPQPNGAPSLLTGSASLPQRFDLRQLGLVSPIKNQKKCGSCVHFCHGGLLETLYAARNNGKIINLSEQMMLDCAVPEHGYVNNAACNGNTMEDSGQFLIDHGVTSEDVYTYKAKQETCLKEGKPVVAKLKEYYHLEPTVEAFKHTLVNEQKPIAAAFAVYPEFMLYRTGVYDWCTPPHGYTGGHAVLIVGYGHFFDQGYWIVKNSWGEKWGEKGFFNYAAGNKFCLFERWGFTGTLE